MSGGKSGRLWIEVLWHLKDIYWTSYELRTLTSYIEGCFGGLNTSNLPLLLRIVILRIELRGLTAFDLIREHDVAASFTDFVCGF